MIKKRFKEEVFDTELLLIYWKIEGFGIEEKDFDWLYNKKGTIYIKEWAPLEKTLVHEMLHFIYDVLLERDISLSLQTEEIFAYLLWFYFDKTYKWLMKTTKTIPLLKIEKK